MYQKILVMNGNYPDVFSKEDLDLHNVIIALVVKTVDSGSIAFEGGMVSPSWCHVMATLVAQTLPVTLIDGYWNERYEHSWVKTPNGHIIDVSPCKCRSAPIMYPRRRSKACPMPWNLLFRKATPSQQKVFDEIRASEKFKTVYAGVMKNSVAIRKKAKQLYKKCCSEKPPHA